MVKVWEGPFIELQNENGWCHYISFHFMSSSCEYLSLCLVRGWIGEIKEAVLWGDFRFDETIRPAEHISTDMSSSYFHTGLRNQMIQLVQHLIQQLFLAV